MAVRSDSGRYLLVLCTCLLSLPGVSPAQEGGLLRGRVVDSASGEVENASIRLLLISSRITKYRAQSGSIGRFRLDAIEPGAYLVAISAPGFRSKFIENVVVEAGREVDLKEVALMVVSCDAPGVNCDPVSTGASEPARPETFSAGKIKVPLGSCVVDVDSGGVVCTVVLDGRPAASPKKDRKSDFWVHLSSDKRVYFEPRNHALLAEPNSSDGCRGAVFLNERVRVDGLGPGSDMCVRSNEGRRSELFFTSEVQPDSKELSIYYVTWK